MPEIVEAVEVCICLRCGAQYPTLKELVDHQAAGGHAEAESLAKSLPFPLRSRYAASQWTGEPVQCSDVLDRWMRG